MDYGYCGCHSFTLGDIDVNFQCEKYEAEIKFKIKTYEIDIAGHVNNIVYVKWLEDLRNKLFEKILPVDELLDYSLYPAVVNTSINYKKQLRYGENPSGVIRVENIKHNLITLKFYFTCNENICAAGEQKCVIINLINGKMDKEKLKTLN